MLFKFFSRHFRLLPSTQMGCQAVISIGVAILLGHFLPLERSYWALLTAMLLISQTWGEGLKKGIQRVSMTVLGGFAGTALYFSLQGSPNAAFIALMLSTFAVIYFADFSYQLMIFFITIMVVFLFGAIQGWTLELLMVRIYETFIGAVIATCTTAFFFPLRARDRLGEKMAGYLKFLQSMAEDIFTMEHYQEKNAKIFSRFLMLKKNIETTSIESIFGRYPRKHFLQLTSSLQLLTYSFTSLIQVSPMLLLLEKYPKIDEKIKEDILILTKNIETVSHFLQGKHTPPTLQSIEIFSFDDLSLAENNMLLDVYSFSYYLVRANDALNDFFKKPLL